MKKLVFAILTIIALWSAIPCPKIALADTAQNENNIYIIFDSKGEQIFESNFVEIGDKIITNELKEYEIVEIDDNNHVGYAEYNGRYEMPQIIKDESGLKFAPNITKKVGLYMTHNDESYVPTDGTESIYGAGGIHDIAKDLKKQFEALGYEAYLDETLHIPHNSSAYSRSALTAQNLLKNDLDAIFDVHRDGASRSLYVTKADGVERCKVRIVVGQKNPNYESNLQFAMYLVSIAKEYCPWLFLDIYYAKGHYNQALSNKALLFEMGSHLVEKELVLASTKELATIVDKTLFSTIVQEDSSLLVTENIDSKNKENIVSNVLDTSSNVQNFKSAYSANVTNFACIFIAAAGIIAVLSFARHLYITGQTILTPNKKKIASKKERK